MHEITSSFYQKMLSDSSEYVGRIENADITLNSCGEISLGCFNTDDFLNFYFKSTDGAISDAKYQCISDPITNVTADVLCALTKGKTLQEALLMNDDEFLQFIGCEDELVRAKAGLMLEMLREGIHKYQAEAK
jgi:NifU-like protein involved in Fe-S cluster formation